MIHAVLRHLHSPDVASLVAYRPEDPERFRLLVQLMVGSDAGMGEESFDLIVTTPRSVADEMTDLAAASNGIVIRAGHGMLLVTRFDYDAILAFLESAVGECSGDSWEEVAAQVGRLGVWEFADYVDNP